jgi:hypothetical protein
VLYLALFVLLRDAMTQLRAWRGDWPWMEAGRVTSDDPEEPPAEPGSRFSRNKSRIGANILGASGVYRGMKDAAMAR